MYSGTGNRKVGEYGGNTLGYGSKSVLGSGWPKDVIKVETNIIIIKPILLLLLLLLRWKGTP